MMGLHYPWQTWADGARWRVCQGEDYRGTTSNFLRMLRVRIGEQGYGLIVYEETPGCLEFQRAKKSKAEPGQVIRMKRKVTA